MLDVMKRFCAVCALALCWDQSDCPVGRSPVGRMSDSCRPPPEWRWYDEGQAKQHTYQALQWYVPWHKKEALSQVAKHPRQPTNLSQAAAPPTPARTQSTIFSALFSPLVMMAAAVTAAAPLPAVAAAAAAVAPPHAAAAAAVLAALNSPAPLRVH